jgi:hypothetical protein
MCRVHPGAVALLPTKVWIAAVIPDSSKHPWLENAQARQLLAAFRVPTGATA